MNLDALVAPLRADVVSGAAVVGRTAAEVVRRVAEGSETADEKGFRDLLGRLVLRILDAQPAMAPLVTLGSRVLAAADGAESVQAARGAVVDAVARFKEALEVGGREVGERAREILPDRGRIVTISHSSTVQSALSGLGAGDSEVVCLESRPLSEGRRLARELARQEISVLYAVDAAAWSLTAGAAGVLVGADSIGDRGVVNKIGSRALVEAGRSEGVPTYALADRTKLLPPGFPQHTDDDRPGEEVWSSPPGVRVHNRYFEAVPLEVFEAVITEEGIRSPEEIEDTRREIPVPEELRRWAASRAQ